MWVHNGAVLCFLLSIFVMKIPESQAKFTDNSWMSDAISSDVCKFNPINRVECGQGGISKSACQSRGCCFDDSIPNLKWCFQKQAGNMSSMAESIKERLENIPSKRDTTSELSKTLIKLDDFIRNFEHFSAQDIMNIPQYNILEDLFLKIVENPSLDDHFPDFASSFAWQILPKVIQSKKEDSPLLKSKLETPFPEPVDDSADLHEEKVNINGNFENCVLKDKPGERCFGVNWVSTGLYAKQGQLVKVTVPSNIVGKFDIQLGAHTDSPFEDNQEKWLNGENNPRPCCITQFYDKDLIKEETRLLSAYGGLIYINVPVSSQLGNFTLKFDKVITSPTFKEGKTTKEQWDKMLTSTKSPMVELEVPGVIVTIPKFHFDHAHYNMERLSSRFTEVMQAFFDLQGYVMPIPHRYVYAYIQPGIAGHSGYPIMDFSANEILNPQLYSMELLELANGTDKQFFSSVSIIPHEIGHNIQNGMWNPAAIGETTNEIFAHYINETVHNVKNPKIDNDETDLFMVVRDECSWNTYKKFFKYYNEEIDESMVPKNDNEKFSLIARVLSEKCNKNLIPFFKWFYWPISSEDEEATKNLPEWKGIIDRLENSSKFCTPDSTSSVECICLNTTGVGLWNYCAAGEFCSDGDGACKQAAGKDFLKEKDTDFTVTEIGSEITGEEQECDGPDYVKEKDIDFTVTEIGSKKSDGELEFALT